MKKFLLVFLILGITAPLMAQDIELSEVVVTPANYKYLTAVDNQEAAVPVKLLEQKVANYDLMHSDIYDDSYATYTVSFYIPEGKIVAAYDGEGNIIRTIERFDNTKLPDAVRDAVVERFPNWIMADNSFRVTYHNKKGVNHKGYKITLKNGDQVLKVKVDADGNFM
ncbi:nicotinate-nucleotide adenylyltransferase [Robertkochia sediminum]|uniref:nicotinate-nucleotide adenylyltransferase n=1 Tax=Robertkochia sediminum TaxID=2785326 RepID=UPI0019320775|nr:nicotinate-nucleotide adenylyltransferase [Robertkochia sediminum]MBL7473386.1 nicotinate-nucleotide adenylyltransferase [Robertkochia sediminum]